MVKESASKIKQDNTKQMILLKNGNRQDSLEGLSSLSYTPIKAYRTAVLGVLGIDDGGQRAGSAFGIVLLDDSKS